MINRADQFDRVFFIYSSGFSAAVAAAAGTTSVTVSIDSQTDFECRYITLAIRQANLIVSTFGGTLAIQFSGSGMLLQNAAIPTDALLGTGQRPYYLVPPQIFTANGTITVTLTSNVATSTDFCIAFHGNKLFAPGARARS